MSKQFDIAEQTKGRLTAIRRVGSTHGNAIWLFRCACNNKEIEVLRCNFVSGHTASCGCLTQERRADQRGEKSPLFGRCGELSSGFKHGHASGGRVSRTYESWQRMVQRCTNPNHQHFKYYGGANPPITICDRWLNSFEAFLADMGERPAKTSLGRFGDTGNYEPENCAWQTDAEQKSEQKTKRQLAILNA